MNSVDLEMILNSMGRKIIWGCLGEIGNHTKNPDEFMKIRIYEVIKRYLDENYRWLPVIDRETISANLFERGIYSYVNKYDDPSKSPSRMISHPFAFGMNEELKLRLFNFIMQDISAYIDSLGMLHSSDLIQNIPD